MPRPLIPTFRVHQSDLRGTDPRGARLLRCHACNDTGQTTLNRDVCASCGGRGVISECEVWDPIQVVPDSERSDYKNDL